jgi:hypothetical protein
MLAPPVTLQSWHDFFMLAGTAAATLLGLVFVAASIAAAIPNEKLGDMSTRNLWILPIVYAFLRVLTVCAVGLIPGQPLTSFGWELAVLAGVDFGRVAWVVRGMVTHHRSREKLTAADWGWYVIYPGAATTVLLAEGVMLVMGSAVSPWMLAGGILGHLVVGVHNAWELADWLATRQ